MKTTLVSVITLGLLTLAAHPQAGEPAGGKLVRAIRWSEAPLPPNTTIVKSAPRGGDALLVIQTEPRPVSIALLRLDNPGIHAKAYALRGQLRYRNVEGTGYIELWNEFPAQEAGQPKPRYFSRSLAEAGPFSKLSGSAEWRDLFVPFDATQGKDLPTKLELNLVLAGAGEVEVSDLELLEFADAGAMWAAMGVGAANALTMQQQAWTTAAVSAGAVIVAVAVWFFFIRRRRAVEVRRMKAMDEA
jgi:hypothetical protein